MNVADVPSDSSDGVELLKDTGFAAGFLGRPWGPSIPDGDHKGKYWGLYSGTHKGYVDEFGEEVQELTEHHLPVSHVVDENSPSCLRISQYNNYKLPAGDPRRDKRLIRRMIADRRGSLRMYFNSQNEIRNAAISYGPKFAHDTWPHFLIIQDFENPLPLARAGRVVVRCNLQMISSKQLSTWPTGLPGAYISDLIVPVFILVQENSQRGQMIWVGAMLYSDDPRRTAPFAAREQHGVAFYHRLPNGWTDFPAVGEKRLVEIDVKELLREAIARFGDINSGLPTNADDYHLVHINFGWEIVGHWESELILSDISVRAYPR